MSNAAQQRQPSGHYLDPIFVGVATNLGITPRGPHGAYFDRTVGPTPHPLDILVFLHMEREMRKNARLVSEPGNYGLIDLPE